ncbi:hypothetical protein [Tannerella forsythia]|nr:hypothetical protein [Tannerella forsythia]
MTRIKQISIWLIALMGLITALGAAAQNSGNTGPLRWEYNAGTNTLSITGTGAMPNLHLQTISLGKLSKAESKP